MSEIEGIPLFIYTPQGKRVRKGYGFRETNNFHVVLGFRDYFKTIRSANAGKLTLGYSVTYAEYEQYWEAAERLRDNPDLFLKELIGTCDKRSKEYRKFKENCAEYTAFIMKKKFAEK